MASPGIADFLLARISDDEEWVRNAGNDFADPRQPDSSARVLAKCKADRRIVELAAQAADFLDTARATLRLLALPYADHPDYDEAWRP